MGRASFPVVCLGEGNFDISILSSCSDIEWIGDRNLRQRRCLESHSMEPAFPVTHYSHLGGGESCE
jgi:hypothetical protein